MEHRSLIKIYGERNTGTNYLHQLVEGNLDADLLPGSVPLSVLRWRGYLPKTEFFDEMVRDLYFFLNYRTNLGWKHSLVKPVEQLGKYKITQGNLSFVTVTKNPYSWLLSLYKRPYHQHWSEKPDFETFLSLPWCTVRRENSPKKFTNPIEMWNIKNRAYLQLKRKFPTIDLKYESLLLDPEQEVMSIKDQFSLTQKVKHFQNIEKSTKGDQKDFLYYQKYYIEERWRGKLSPTAIHTINEHLDFSLMEHFGYTKLT
jgi:hypothetical protein